METRSHIVLISAGALLGITNYVRAAGTFPPSLFQLILNSILGCCIAGLLIAVAIGLAKCFNSKEHVFEDAQVIASSTVIVMCIGFLFLKFSSY